MLNEYARTWVASAQKCRPVEDWHWKIMERDYLIEVGWVREAFVGGHTPWREPPEKRGRTWAEVEEGARAIRDAIAARFAEHSRPLPWANPLWRL